MYICVFYVPAKFLKECTQKLGDEIPDFLVENTSFQNYFIQRVIQIPSLYSSYYSKLNNLYDLKKA